MQFNINAVLHPERSARDLSGKLNPRLVSIRDALRRKLNAGLKLE
jgi:hypothetical protein